MTSGFFADQDSTVLIEFPAEEGSPAVNVTMRKMYDAGITEDVANNTLTLKLKDGDKSEEREGRIALGNLFTLQQMVIKIEVEGGRTYTKPIGKGILRNMRPEAKQRLIRVINENNPLPEEEDLEMIPDN